MKFMQKQVLKGYKKDFDGVTNEALESDLTEKNGQVYWRFRGLPVVSELIGATLMPPYYLNIYFRVSNAAPYLVSWAWHIETNITALQNDDGSPHITTPEVINQVDLRQLSREQTVLLLTHILTFAGKFVLENSDFLLTSEGMIGVQKNSNEEEA